MHTPRILALAAFAITTGFFVGCDETAADREAKAAVTQARLTAYGTKAEPAPADELARITISQQAYDKAFKAKSNNAITTIAINTALAGTHLEAAQYNINLADRKDLEIERLLVQMRTMAEAINTGNVIIAGYQGTEPKDALAAVATRSAAVTGDGQAADWVTATVKDSANEIKLPTLSATKTEVSRLEGEIAAKTQEAADLDAQRTEQLAAAETAGQEAATATGDAGLSAAKNEAEARMKASMLVTQAEDVKFQTDRLQADLAVQKALETSLAAAIEHLCEKTTAFNTGWTETKKQIDAQKALVGQLASAESPAASLAASGKQVANEMVTLAKLRADALASLTAAEQYYGKAQDEAKKFAQDTNAIITEAGEGVRKAGYEALRETVDPQRSAAQIAYVRSRMAAVNSAQVGVLGDVVNTRDAVRAALKPLGTETPADLETGTYEADLKKHVADAETAFKNAEESIDNITEGSQSAMVKNFGLTLKLVNLAVWTEHYNRVARAAGVLGDDATKTKELAGAKLEDAKAARQQLIDNNLPIPALPGELGAPAPTAEPSPTPANGATPPADGITPPTIPANGATPTVPATPPANPDAPALE